MELIYNKVFLEHDTGLHPENKKRMEVFGSLKETILENGRKYLELVHTLNYIEQVRKACTNSIPLDADTLTSPGSFKAATHAVAAAVMASQTNNFALVRPPGHHAYSSHGSGFCLFNNIAIACQKLVNEGKKIAIIDIDGHFGDGTCYYFYDCDKVLYCSLHQYPAFPEKGFCDEIGEGKGKGFSVNVPLPPGSSDDLFIKSISEIIIPIVEQFNPDQVGISAGFDAYRLDPLLNLNISVNSFYKIGGMLQEKFKNLFACLEGGYNLEGLPKCLFNFIDGINGLKMKHDEEMTLSNQSIIDEYNSRMKILFNRLAPYWKFNF